MPSINTDVIRKRLAEIDRDMIRLEGERDGLKKLLVFEGENVPSQSQFARVMHENAKPVANRHIFVSTRATSDAYQRIRELLSKTPGLTKKQITDQLAGTDSEQRKVVYNAAHSLARRKKLRMDENKKLYPIA